jgi:hypothetical protein
MKMSFCRDIFLVVMLNEKNAEICITSDKRRRTPGGENLSSFDRKAEFLKLFSAKILFTKTKPFFKLSHHCDKT